MPGYWFAYIGLGQIILAVVCPSVQQLSHVWKIPFLSSLPPFLALWMLCPLPERFLCMKGKQCNTCPTYGWGFFPCMYECVSFPWFKATVSLFFRFLWECFQNQRLSDPDVLDKNWGIFVSVSNYTCVALFQKHVGDFCTSLHVPMQWFSTRRLQPLCGVTGPLHRGHLQPSENPDIYITTHNRIKITVMKIIL